MKRFGFRWGVLWIILVAAQTYAQPPRLASEGPEAVKTASIPAGGVSVLTANGESDFRLSTKPDAAELEQLNLSEREAPLTHAMRIQTLRLPLQYWDIQARTTNTVAVRKGDMLLAAFRARCVESKTGLARTAFVFELNRDPWQKSVDFLVSVGREWQQVFVPFGAERNYGIGEANISFPVGFQVQTIEIGGFSLLNFGPNVRLRDMPGSGYDGQEPDAPWRTAAAERIERIRKADLIVAVVDAQGRPATNAEVHVQMTRHIFPFGSAIAIEGVKEQTADGRKYREFIEKNFNRIVFENDLKWHIWRVDNVWARRFQAETLDWLDKSGIDARGHCLVWPSWWNLPKDLVKLKDDPAALRKRVADHVAEEVAAFRGRLAEWDVINEPFTNHSLMDILGNDVMADWFKQAQAADPKVKLFINDYAILSAGGLDQAHQDHYAQTIRFLIDQKAPLEGIGIQGHFGAQLTSPERMLKILDRFAAFSKDIEVTEFDVSIPDEQLQADFTRDFYTAMFSHPAITGVLMWGFWEGRHWRPKAAMVRKDWSLRPSGQVWMDLVHGKWKTDVAGKTDGQGRFETRGFLGDYQITVSANGKTQTVRTALSKPSGQVQVLLDAGGAVVEK